MDTGSWAEQISCGQVLADLWLANECVKQKMGDTLCGECVGGACDVCRLYNKDEGLLNIHDRGFCSRLCIFDDPKSELYN